MARNNVKRSISMPQEMHLLLAQLTAQRGRDVTEADLIREAIRQFLDEQADVVSSRRHFQQSFQKRLDHLEAATSFHLNILLYLVSALLSTSGDRAIEDAIIRAKRDGNALLEQIRAVRELKERDA